MAEESQRLTSPKVSIIVPVYKVEPYLRRCLDSIAAQTFTDWECMLIDDGSPDASGEICDEYASRDGRFRVIHQENKGVSAARNAGLTAAKGKYIGFVDSDDWIEPNMYEHLYTAVLKTKSDCVVCGFFGQSKHHIKKVCRKEKALKLLFLPKGFGGFSCLRLIAADKIRCIRYDTNISYMEDVKFFYETFKNCKSVYWDNEPLYHYEKRSDSVTQQNGVTPAVRTAIDTLACMCSSEPDTNLQAFIRLFYVDFCVDVALSYFKGTLDSDGSFEMLRKILIQNTVQYFCSIHISVKRKLIAFAICNAFARKVFIKLYAGGRK